MDQLLAGFGFFGAGMCLFSIFSAIGLQGAIYLTIWTIVIHLVYFLVVLSGMNKGKLHKILLNISWTVGWQVTIMFWIYVFPLLNESNRLPLPYWFDFCAHGGVQVFVVALFLRSNETFELRDSTWPVGFGLSYLFLLIIPLKLYGIIIYPLFFEEVFTTLLVIGQSIIVSFAFFWIGMKLKQRKIDKKLD